ncbi:30S ribosomal protein S16 [Dongia mobilis]|jgi:small subunit ribosomal protein S16|uniref:30S ribosomal protein S16 n=1 Tax=Dongia sp. TaxID=1977262 RepID=UPI0026EAEEE6
MSLKIRLARGGAKKRPFYRIVVAESRFARDGRFVERIGSYNPMLTKEDPNRVLIEIERAKHWLSKGALPTERVQHFFAKLGLMDAPKRHDQTKQDKPKAKAVERAKTNAEAAAKAAEAPAAEA